MTEYIEVLNKKKEVIGVVTREEVHDKKLFHKGVHGIVYKDGKIFVQKRSKFKDVFPGFYEVSYSGHIIAGETPLQAAKRELKEELGVEGEFESIGEYKPKNNVVNALYEVFLVKIKKNPVLGEEVELGGFITKKEVQKLLKKRKITPITKLLFKKHLDKI